MVRKIRQKVEYRDLGQIEYQSAWDLQTRLNKDLIADKRAHGTGSLAHKLLFCSHPPVYTLGKSGSIHHLRLDEDGLKRIDASFVKINRGGDITFHGPGQVVGYPIFDLDRFFTDVHKYVRFLEQAIIDLLSEYGLEGERLDGYTGVWLSDHGQNLRKICAIGVHLSRWVTMHGFALNVNTDMSYFEHIVPCGIADDDKTVTSLSKELGRDMDIDEVKSRLKDIFARLFEFDFINQTR